MFRTTLILLGCALTAQCAEKWATVWGASVHGTYPVGSAVAQPDLHLVFPAGWANDQTFRLIIKPDLWSRKFRLRFSNVMGSRPLHLDGVFAGMHESAGRLLPGTNRPVRFHGANDITIEAGADVWSDEVTLDTLAKDMKVYAGRKLAVSFHVVGESGPMTWHSKALQTSYLSGPGTGAHGAEETSDAFPFTTSSWYFLDAVDALLPADTGTVVAFGDSITDGTNSTINGDDRWPDFLSARVHAAVGSKLAIVDEGIGGNQVVGPPKYDKEHPKAGGPSAMERLERDVLNLSSVKTVVWLEGINDLGGVGATPEAIIAGFKEGIARLHARHIRVIGATITSSLNSTPSHGTADVDARRKVVNEFIRHGGAFDGVADFDAATLDAQTGMLRPEFQPSSALGGPGDKLHPNRAGYQAMAGTVNLQDLVR